MGANDSNSPYFSMRNPETNKVEQYPKNPSYIDRIKEQFSLNASHADRVNAARSEIQSNTSRGINSGDERPAKE